MKECRSLVNFNLLERSNMMLVSKIREVTSFPCIDVISHRQLPQNYIAWIIILCNFFRFNCTATYENHVELTHQCLLLIETSQCEMQKMWPNGCKEKYGPQLPALLTICRKTFGGSGLDTWLVCSVLDQLLGICPSSHGYVYWIPPAT